MRKMLVVDDDPVWRALYQTTFGGRFEVVEVAGGLGALASLDRVRPDIIVLDADMPQLDGMELLRRMGDRGWQVPVILCSGTFTADNLPIIPGVFPVQKSHDLRHVWSALEAALPPQGATDSSPRSSCPVEETVWRG